MRALLVIAAAILCTGSPVADFAKAAARTRGRSGRKPPPRAKTVHVQAEHAARTSALLRAAAKRAPTAKTHGSPPKLTTPKRKAKKKGALESNQAAATEASLESAAKTAVGRATAGHVVITMADWSYRGAVLNWMAHMTRLGRSDFLVLALDEALSLLVGAAGARIAMTPRRGAPLLQRTFATKHAAFLAVLEEAAPRNVTVTWSDADCLWVRDYVEFYDASVRPLGADLAAQRGMWPPDVARQYGAALSIGLYTVAPTKAALAFYRRLARRVGKFGAGGESKDDQTTFNAAAVAAGAFTFGERATYGDAESGRRATVTTPAATGLRIALLPYAEFPRGSRGADGEWDALRCGGAFVWHLQAKKKGLSKVTHMARDCVFDLDSSWESATNWTAALPAAPPAERACPAADACARRASEPAAPSDRGAKAPPSLDVRADQSILFVGGMPHSGTSLLNYAFDPTFDASEEATATAAFSVFRDTRAAWGNDEGQWLQPGTCAKKHELAWRAVVNAAPTKAPPRVACGAVWPPYPASCEWASRPELRLTEVDAETAPGAAVKRSRLLASWLPLWRDAASVLVEKTPHHLIQLRYLFALFSTSRAAAVIIVKHPLSGARFWHRWPGCAKKEAGDQASIAVDHFFAAHALLRTDLARPDVAERTALVAAEALVADPARLGALANWALSFAGPRARRRLNYHGAVFRVDADAADAWKAVWAEKLAKMGNATWATAAAAGREDRASAFGYSLLDVAAFDEAAFDGTFGACVGWRDT